MKAMIHLHTFSQDVANALNAHGVVPPPDAVKDDSICGLMVVVGTPPEPPLAAILNYDYENKFWRVDPSVQESQPVEDSE